MVGQNLAVEFKLDDCWVLFTDIWDCNAQPDNGGYGNFEILAGHQKMYLWQYRLSSLS